MSNCLVIIDVQTAFLNKDTAFIPEQIKSLLEKNSYDHVVATRFINSLDTPHFKYVGYTGALDARTQALDPYIESVAEHVFDKSSNSCMTPEFQRYLRINQIHKLYFVGIDTDCCVLSSAFDCFDMSIPFVILTSYCASTAGRDLHKAACQVMLRNFGWDFVK